MSGAPPREGEPVRLREAIDRLRVEILQRLPAEVSSDGARALARRAVASADADFMGAFDRARRTLQRFGMVERSGEVDPLGFEPDALTRVAPLLDFLHERWWRVDVSGLEQLPEHGPFLLVGNHSGLLPWDGLMIAHAVARARPNAERPRFLVADWLATLPFAQPWLARLGGVRACRENAEWLLAHGRPVIAFPEGAKGAAKVYRERYRLQRFGRGGAVRVALEAGVPLIPVAVVGAEETHPVLFKLHTLARFIGAAFVPVTPTFPWLGPLGLVPLPSKWSIRFGEPAPLEELGTAAASDDLLVSRLTEDLRRRIQTMLDELLRSRDDKPDRVA